jgi:hypothetical protein
MSRRATADVLELGGEPRVDLLPPEVKSRRRARTLRRSLVLAFVGAVALMGAGTTAAWLQATKSQAALAAAQAQTSELLTQQVKYSEVRQVQEAVDVALAARQIGVSTEIDWRGYLQQIRDVLPPDVIVDTVAVDSASPLVAYVQPTVPLQPARVATLTMTLTSPGLPAVPQWLNALKAMPGYADGTPTSITRSETGSYTVNLTLHVNDGAYSRRFASPENSGK